MTRRPGSVHERSCYCLVSHVANRTASPVTTNPQRTPELDLIYERRRRLGLSLATAGKIAGISDSYWKAIEDGTREIRGPKCLRTLAAMAYAVGIEPEEMDAAARPDIAADLRIVRELAAADEERIRADAALYDKVGGADESFRLCGDWKLWAAMALQGRVAYVAEPLNYFRSHNTSVRSSSGSMRTDALEYLRVIRWILERVTPTENVRKKVREIQSDHWVPVVMSTHASFGLKRKILRSVREIDPHPVRSAIRPALKTIQRKFLRHWHVIPPATTSESR